MRRVATALGLVVLVAAVAGLVAGSASAAGHKKLVEGTVYDTTWPRSRDLRTALPAALRAGTRGAEPDRLRAGADRLPTQRRGGSGNLAAGLPAGERLLHLSDLLRQRGGDQRAPSRVGNAAGDASRHRRALRDPPRARRIHPPSLPARRIVLVGIGLDGDGEGEVDGSGVELS